MLLVLLFGDKFILLFAVCSVCLFSTNESASISVLESKAAKHRSAVLLNSLRFPPHICDGVVGSEEPPPRGITNKLAFDPIESI